MTSSGCLGFKHAFETASRIWPLPPKRTSFAILVKLATAAVSSLRSIYQRYFTTHMQLEHPASFEAFAGLQLTCDGTASYVTVRRDGWKEIFRDTTARHVVPCCQPLAAGQLLCLLLHRARCTPSLSAASSSGFEWPMAEAQHRGSLQKNGSVCWIQAFFR